MFSEEEEDMSCSETRHVFAQTQDVAFTPKEHIVPIQNTSHDVLQAQQTVIAQGQEIVLVWKMCIVIAKHQDVAV